MNNRSRERHYLVNREGCATEVACESGFVLDSEDVFEPGIFVRADGKRVVVEETLVTCAECRQSEAFQKNAPLPPKVPKNQARYDEHQHTRSRINNVIKVIVRRPGFENLPESAITKAYAVGLRGVRRDRWTDAELEYELDVFLTSFKTPIRRRVSGENT